MKVKNKNMFGRDFKLNTSYLKFQRRKKEALLRAKKKKENDDDNKEE